MPCPSGNNVFVYCSTVCESVDLLTTISGTVTPLALSLSTEASIKGLIILISSGVRKSFNCSNIVDGLAAIAAFNSSPVVTKRDTTPSRSDTTSSFLFSNRNNIFATPKPPEGLSVFFTVPAISRNCFPITLAGIPAPLSITVTVRFGVSMFTVMRPCLSPYFSKDSLIASNAFCTSSFMETEAILSGLP